VHSENNLEPAQSNTPCKQIQPSSRVKTLNGPRVRRIIPVGKERFMEEMICRKAKSQVQSERVREDASGDSEDGEDDDDV